MFKGKGMLSHFVSDKPNLWWSSKTANNMMVKLGNEQSKKGELTVLTTQKGTYIHTMCPWKMLRGEWKEGRC